MFFYDLFYDVCVLTLQLLPRRLLPKANGYLFTIFNVFFDHHYCPKLLNLFGFGVHKTPKEAQISGQLNVF